MPSSTGSAAEPTARTALLEAALRLILTEGYAAVTTRRVAAEAGVNPGLVYYYFGPMDKLLVAVLHEYVDRSRDRQAEALRSEQPLWELWDLIREQTNTVLNLEFLALGNHRDAVRTELKDSAKRFREMQVEALSEILADRGVDSKLWPPEGVMLLLDGVARFMGEEQAYGLDVGHAQATAIVERLITEVEGKRRVRRKRAR